MAGGTQSIPVRRLGLALTCERACAGTGILWERDWILRTGCIKKKVIELQRAIASEVLCVWTRFFYIRKDQAFSCWMIYS
jgi:hypothetical protein